MIHTDLKKWEIAGLAVCAAAALVLRILEETGVIIIPSLWIIVVLMIFAAVLMLWRSVCFLIKFLKIRNSGESAKAVVLRYKTDIVKGKRQTAEIIEFKDRNGKKQQRALYGMYLTQKNGRKYTIYYDPKKEDSFCVLPPSLILVCVDLFFAVIIEGVLAAVLFI